MYFLLLGVLHPLLTAHCPLPTVASNAAVHLMPIDRSPSPDHLLLRSVPHSSSNFPILFYCIELISQMLQCMWPPTEFPKWFLSKMFIKIEFNAMPHWQMEWYFTLQKHFVHAFVRQLLLFSSSCFFFSLSFYTLYKYNSNKYNGKAFRFVSKCYIYYYKFQNACRCLCVKIFHCTREIEANLLYLLSCLKLSSFHQ